MKEMFVLGFVIGMFLGAVFGVVIYAVVRAARTEDRRKRYYWVALNDEEDWGEDEIDYYRGY